MARTRTYALTPGLTEQITEWAVGDRRIFRIDLLHDGDTETLTVGEAHPYTGEMIVAIFESNAYLVCTPHRGIIEGEPIQVGKDDVQHVEEFD